jgi:hypothetical protein
MRQSGYGPDRDEPTVDLQSAEEQEAIIAEYVTRTNKADPEIGTTTGSASAVSSTKGPSDDAN